MTSIYAIQILTNLTIYQILKRKNLKRINILQLYINIASAMALHNSDSCTFLQVVKILLQSKLRSYCCEIPFVYFTLKFWAYGI